MSAIVRIIDGIIAFILLFIGIAGLAVTGIVAAIIAMPPGLESLTILIALLPYVLVVMAIVGFWGVFKNNRNVLVAFNILLLPMWYIGTLVGGICLLILFLPASNKKEIIRDL